MCIEWVSERVKSFYNFCSPTVHSLSTNFKIKNVENLKKTFKNPVVKSVVQNRGFSYFSLSRFFEVILFMPVMLIKLASSNSIYSLVLSSLSQKKN